MTEMTQSAPYPTELEDLVAHLTYRPGWTFRLGDVERDEVDGQVVGRGLTFMVLTKTVDSYHPELTTRVWHYFIVPAATYNRASWQRWLFERLLDVERHECMEFFQVDGVRPFAPTHGPGDDPYAVHEYIDEVARRTRYTGEVLERT